jgi:hypothetical protein
LLETKVLYVFVWHSYVDARSCSKCVALNGREYHDQDVLSHVLVDPEFRAIWDLDANRSLMHGGSGTCRCQLEIRVESVNVEIPETVQFIDEYAQLDEMSKSLAEKLM